MVNKPDVFDVFYKCGNFVNIGPYTPIEKFGIFAIRVKIATYLPKFGKYEEFRRRKHIGLRYLGYITGKFH